MAARLNVVESARRVCRNLEEFIMRRQEGTRVAGEVMCVLAQPAHLAYS